MPELNRVDVARPGVSLLRVAPLLLIGVVLFAYSNALKGPFVFDDEISIPLNPSIRTLWPIWVPMFPAGHLGVAGRPLVSISYAINYAIDGLHPRGYHAGNILLHLISAWILFSLTRRALNRLGHARSDGVALFATLIWAVHPLLTDTVTYIINRTEGLACLFMLLTLYAFERSIDSPHRRRWQFVAILASLAGVASKEMAAMIGPIVVLYDGLVVSSSWKQVWTNRKGFYVFILLDWVLMGLLLSTVDGKAKLGGVGHITPWGYLLMQSQVLLMYIKLCVWPTPLVISYVDWAVPDSLSRVWPEMLCVSLLFVVTVFLVVRRSPIAIVGVTFFLVLAPTSSILPLPAEPAAERRMYLPLAAVVLGVCLAVERLLRPIPRGATIAAVLAGLAILTLVTLTTVRNEDYSSVLSIWSDTVAKRPGNPVAHEGLGAELSRQGYLIDAVKRFDEAIRLSDTYLEPRILRAMALSKMGNDDEALAELHRCLSMSPDHAYALTMLGAVLHHKGDRAQAERVWQDVLSKNPGDDEARRLLDASRQGSP